MCALVPVASAQSAPPQLRLIDPVTDETRAYEIPGAALHKSHARSSVGVSLTMADALGSLGDSQCVAEFYFQRPGNTEGYAGAVLVPVSGANPEPRWLPWLGPKVGALWLPDGTVHRVEVRRAVDGVSVVLPGFAQGWELCELVTRRLPSWAQKSMSPSGVMVAFASWWTSDKTSTQLFVPSFPVPPGR